MPKNKTTAYVSTQSGPTAKTGNADAGHFCRRAVASTQSFYFLFMGKPLERRLAAILAADVVGYSRLIGADEAGTLAALRSLLKEVVEPTLKRHRGRVVKLMGDGLLAEFASVVDAVGQNPLSREPTFHVRYFLG